MHFSSYLGHKRGSLCQVFLAETVETGTKNRCVIRFCEESLGKIKFRAFPKCPRILSLESVDYFGTSERYKVVKKK